jgi:hypothetical protein
MSDQNNSEAQDTQPQNNAAVNTGAALVSGALFALVGTVVGSKVGGIANDRHHGLGSKIGGWVGGITFSVLSLYANFKSQARHLAQLKTAQKPAEPPMQAAELIETLDAQAGKSSETALPETKTSDALGVQKIPAMRVHSPSYEQALNAAPHENLQK